MAQKDKVKELVGRGLDSYHTKALQQIHRIEKKNKEQNHKISILSNELDNDYLTKTEEGSVISLEHSKEGMVYLDELQGNTLVNYCTDGSKEMTLNGDIDVEGTFVTTTEGVDNGKIDVMCEGNTLVNLKINTGSNCSISWANSNEIDYFTLTENSYLHLKGNIANTARELGLNWCYGILGSINLDMLKPNTNYTLILDNKYDAFGGVQLQQGNATNNYIKQCRKIDKNTYILTTKDSFDELSRTGIILYGSLSWDYKGGIDFKTIAFLEGDWSNREVPTEFFEGMKSVGQDDTNGHKIEILSNNNGSLSNISTHNFNTDGNVVKHRLLEPIKTGESFKVCYTNNSSKNTALGLKFHYPSESRFGAFGGVGSHSCIFTNNYGETLTSISTYRDNNYDGLVIENFSITKVKNIEDTSFVDYKPYQSNKKEILLNEPLRGLPNGIKDRKVKIGGKWYIERNCREMVLDGSDDEIWSKENTNSNGITPFYLQNNSMKKLPTYINAMLCNKLKVVAGHQTFSSDNCISGYSNVNKYPNENWIYIFIKVNTVDDLKQYLQQNPTTVIYQLATPIYEPLEVEPTLNTYNDVTHISNNSIIPANMKIQNSGYNAIIKPATQYTVALDTNKNGTIGMNLGGAKVTTTNNVATITTPATLTDDSLRLYGKDIKGSKVRLLEGDKTNWIPSHFEGMKSSFEDKLQEDGTYKMEILSNDMSLFDIHERNFYMGNGASNLKITQRKIEYDADANYRYLYYDRFDFVKGKKYTIAIKGNNSRVLYHNNNNLQATGITSNNIKYVTFVAGHNAHTRGIENGERGACKVVIEDVWIYEGEYDESKHTTTKSNKIQFSSIEPLRGVGNVKDRLMFKDSKLMIERNCGYRRLDGTENWSKFNTNTKTVTQFFTDNSKQKHGTMIGTCTTVPWIGGRNANQEKEGLAGGGGAGTYLWLDVFNHKLETLDSNGIKNWLRKNNIDVVFALSEPTYEEIPFELQKIILEGYENGTLFFDTNIPPTSTITYAGETPIVKSVKLNKTEVLNNTNDINDNIIPYLMDMDYRVVMLQLATEDLEGGVSMARLFGGTYEMLKRDILSKRLSRQEYGYRLADYFNAGKLTEEQVRELEDLR